MMIPGCIIIKKEKIVFRKMMLQLLGIPPISDVVCSSPAEVMVFAVAMGRSWSEAFLRWPEIDLSVFSWSGVFRWSELDLAGMAPSWAQLDFSILDRIVWSFVTAVESVALVATLCFFLAFCGCSI